MSKEVGEMVRSRDVVQAEGSARTEGARRATGVRADGAAAGAGSLAPGQRWSASRKRDVVLRLLRGESLEALSREAGVEIYRLDAWRERAMAGLELGLKDRHGEPVAEVLDAAKRHGRGPFLVRAGAGLRPPVVRAALRSHRLRRDVGQKQAGNVAVGQLHATRGVHVERVRGRCVGRTEAGCLGWCAAGCTARAAAP